MVHAYSALRFCGGYDFLAFLLLYAIHDALVKPMSGNPIERLQ